jgi:hypothetical protein
MSNINYIFVTFINKLLLMKNIYNYFFYAFIDVYTAHVYHINHVCNFRFEAGSSSFRLLFY